MYTILLADDEPIIIRGLRKMIDWDKLNASVIDEAYDGSKAMEKILLHKPDILISDISMPKKTGLELLREIREAELDTKVIFLSAFQEFSYAKEAVKYGAVDYLLKPLQQNELEDAVLKAEQMLKKVQSIELPKESDKIQEAFQNFNNSYKDMDLYEQFKEIGIDTTGRRFVGICFAVKPVKHTDEGMYELLKFSVFKRIQKHFRNRKIGFAIKPDDTMCNLLVALLGEDDEQWLKSAVTETLEMVQSEYHVPLTVGIGDYINEMSNLKYAYKTARFAADLHYFHDQTVINFKDIKKVYTRSIDDYNETYRNLLESVLNHEQSYLKQLQELIDLIQELHYGSRYAVLNRCIQFCSDLFRDLLDYNLVSESDREGYERFMNLLRRQNSYHALKENFLNYLNKFIAGIVDGSNIREAATIIRVKEYIKAHYAEDISLKHVSEVAYMNPYYFSSFFKKETGKNYKQYLTEIRMKEAIKLLMNSEMKTYAIAKAVGYHNVRHFTEKFKEIYGESPNEYKKIKKS